MKLPINSHYIAVGTKKYKIQKVSNRDKGYYMCYGTKPNGKRFWGYSFVDVYGELLFL